MSIKILHFFAKHCIFNCVAIEKFALYLDKLVSVVLNPGKFLIVSLELKIISLNHDGAVC